MDALDRALRRQRSSFLLASSKHHRLRRKINYIWKESGARGTEFAQELQSRDAEEQSYEELESKGCRPEVDVGRLNELQWLLMLRNG